MKKKTLAIFTIVATTVASATAVLVKKKNAKNYSLDEVMVDLTPRAESETDANRNVSKFAKLFKKKPARPTKSFTRVTDADCPYKVEVDNDYL